MNAANRPLIMHVGAVACHRLNDNETRVKV
jgi:hypothetical protein